MEKPTFKTLCKMHIQELTNFPFIEQDFDFITNYQFLCQVIDHLNQVIENSNTQNESIINLYNAFTTLKDYVDNYFENLDVQEEINNKLDAMTESGELTAIISAYVDPIYQAYEDEINGIIDSQNSRITSVENALQSVASGSPAGVYSTYADLVQADPDHSRTYVVSADGHWYYYNGTTWADGGVYQSAESGDNFQILENKVNSSYINIYNSSMSYSGYINSNGIQSTTGTQKYAKVPITENTTYYLYRKSEYYPRTGDYFGFIDTNDNLFGITVFQSNIIIINNKKYVKIQAPANAEYVIFNVKLTQFDDVATSVLYTKNTITGIDGYDKDLRDKIDTFNTNYKLDICNNEYINNFCLTSTTSAPEPVFHYVANSSSLKQNVDAETTYYLYRKSQSYDVLRDSIAYYDNTDTLIGYDYTTNLEKITLLNGEKCIKIITPENTSYLRLNVHLTTFYNDENNMMITKIPTEYPIVSNDLDLRNYVLNVLPVDTEPSLKNRLRNKKWLCLGDSITASTFRSTKNYHDYIAERCGCTVTNLGHSGSGYIQQSNNICNTIDGLDGTEGYDYITIFAGTNDRSQPIGTFGSTDKTEIYGAINYAITQLISKYPNAKIGILTPLPRATNYGIASNQKLYQIANAEIEVANNYSIPVLNQYVESGLRPWNATNNQTFFSCEVSPQGDGLHPNELGHEWISYPIQEFLQTL